MGRSDAPRRPRFCIACLAFECDHMTSARLRLSERPPWLTWQDVRIARMLAKPSWEGNKQAAWELGMTTSTLKFNLFRICSMLRKGGYEVGNQTGVATWAWKYLPGAV